MFASCKAGSVNITFLDSNTPFPRSR